MISALRVFQAAAFIAKRSFSRPAGLRKRPLTLLKRRKPRLCDLHVVLRGVEAGAEVADRGQTNTARRAVADFDRARDEHFALSGATAAAGERVVLTTQGNFRFVDLDEPAERIAVWIAHGPAQLGAQQPRRLIGAERQLLLQL